MDWMDRKKIWIEKKMDGWMDKKMKKKMDGWMDGLMDG